MINGQRARRRRAGIGWSLAFAAVATAAVGTALGAGGIVPVHAAGSQNGDAKKWRFDESAATLPDVATVIGANVMHSQGYTGTGVGIALVDTGVAQVPGLRPANVVNGPDLSFESQIPSLQHQDTYGHGTHLAGIIAGEDGTGSGGFRGIAPGATLTSVKVGVADGSVDVSQVIAGIDWVVAHRNDDADRPIRVLNLAYGTDGTQDYRTDPLTHAVENAWRAGIVVVVAAGNNGAEDGRLTNPARDPYVLTVGAVDTLGTGDSKDDTVTDFSSRGDATRSVDLVAPGRSIVSLRDPGSYVDNEFAGARVDDRFFKGSGTSQSAAVTSGAVALLLQQYPDLTPDQVKGALMLNASKISKADRSTGSGELNVAAAAKKGAKKAEAQTWQPSTGQGSLEAARGTVHVDDQGVLLTGERDIFGPFSTTAWARASDTRTSWSGGTWMGNTWAGAGWTGSSWAGRTWSGGAWPGRTWSGRTWSDGSWTGRTWSENAWS